MNANSRSHKHTSLLSVNLHLHVRVFEGPPLEIFLVATTLNASTSTLPTRRLLFAALQSLRFARHTACVQTPSVCSSGFMIRLAEWQVDTITALALLRFRDAAVSAAAHRCALLSRRLLFRLRPVRAAIILGGTGWWNWRTGRVGTGSQEDRRRRDCDGLSHIGVRLRPFALRKEMTRNFAGLDGSIAVVIRKSSPGIAVYGYHLGALTSIHVWYNGGDTWRCCPSLAPENLNCWTGIRRASWVQRVWLTVCLSTCPV